MTIIKTFPPRAGAKTEKYTAISKDSTCVRHVSSYKKYRQNCKELYKDLSRDFYIDYIFRREHESEYRCLKRQYYYFRDLPACITLPHEFLNLLVQMQHGTLKLYIALLALTQPLSLPSYVFHVRFILKKLGMSRITLIRHLDALKEIGLIDSWERHVEPEELMEMEVVPLNKKAIGREVAPANRRISSSEKKERLLQKEITHCFSGEQIVVSMNHTLHYENTGMYAVIPVQFIEYWNTFQYAGAVKLYVYCCLKAHITRGYFYESTATMAKNLGVTEKTIIFWFKDLAKTRPRDIIMPTSERKANLIQRHQVEYNGPCVTQLMPIGLTQRLFYVYKVCRQEKRRIPRIRFLKEKPHYIITAIPSKVDSNGEAGEGQTRYCLRYKWIRSEDGKIEWKTKRSFETQEAAKEWLALRMEELENQLGRKPWLV